MVTTPDPSAEWPICVLEIDGALHSKSNYRRTRASSRSKDWATHRAFEDSLAILARESRPASWPMGDRDQPLNTRPDVVVLIAAQSLLDTANMAKSVTDALEEVLFYNDASVRFLTCTSTRSRSDQSATILVAALPAQSTLDDWALAANRLLERYQSDHPDN